MCVEQSGGGGGGGGQACLLARDKKNYNRKGSKKNGSEYTLVYWIKSGRNNKSLLYSKLSFF